MDLGRNRRGGCRAGGHPFETVGDEVFRRYARNWKPSTLRVNRGYYWNQILPWFEGRPIADFTSHDVQRWFASLHETPLAADRSAPILSVIMRQAEIYGYRPEGANPCVGIKRYRRQGRKHFLSAAEIRRLGEALARREPGLPQVVAIILLLVLTGCHKSEVVTLKCLSTARANYSCRIARLSRARSGSILPRAILDSVPRESVCVFPSPLTDSCLHTVGVDNIWNRLRVEADLCDVRLHDLRHYCVLWPYNLLLSLALWFFTLIPLSLSHRIRSIS